MAIQNIQYVAPIQSKSPIKQIGFDPSQKPFNEFLQQAVSQHQPSPEINAQVAANQVAAAGAVPDKSIQSRGIEEESASAGASGEQASEEEIGSPSKSSSMIKGLLSEDTASPHAKVGQELIPYQGPGANKAQDWKNTFAQTSQKTQTNPSPLSPVPGEALTPKNVNQKGNALGQAVTPFQLFLDKAVEFFEMVSNLEEKSDTLMVDYVEGKASLEDLTLIKTKLGVALSFSVTLVNQVTQTFKEIQNMQV